MGTFLKEYFRDGYLTLMVVASLVVMMTSNRGGNIKIGSKLLIYVVAVLTLILSICEYVGSEYAARVRYPFLLYLNAAFIYMVYPLIALLILYLTQSRRRLFLAIPLVLNTLLAIIDLSEKTRLIYGYDENRTFISGPLYWVPFFVEGMYIVLLANSSIQAIKGGDRAHGLIVAFMAFSCVTTIVLVPINFISNQAIPTVVAIEILVYYFYLSAIEYRRVREALSAEKLELERSKNNLLMAQIRPHFINSNLAVIRSLCYEDGEKAVEMIDHFSAYLRENIKQVDDRKLVPFEKEMESIDNYLYLEMQRFQDRIQVIKELQVVDFDVPPLAIETIVENSIRHGISMTGRKGTVIIRTEEKDGYVTITVKDDGMGFDVASANFDGSTHVGVKNVMDRFHSLLSGNVIVESTVGEGTTVTIRFPRGGETKA